MARSMPLLTGMRSAPTTEMYTRCRTPVPDAARTRLRVFSSSPVALPAQCTMISTPFTAASIPSPVARSPLTNSIPSPASRLLLLSTLTLQPAFSSLGATWRPSVPVPPVTRICCIVLPLLFFSLSFECLAFDSHRRQKSRDKCDTPFVFPRGIGIERLLFSVSATPRPLAAVVPCPALPAPPYRRSPAAPGGYRYAGQRWRRRPVHPVAGV